MSQKLAVLLSMFVIISVAEGVVLCKKVNKTGNAAKNVSLANLRLSKEYYNGLRRASNQKAEYNLSESWNDKILRGALVLDDELELKGGKNKARFRQESSDLKGLLRAAELKKNIKLKRSSEIRDSRKANEKRSKLKRFSSIDYKSWFD